MRQVKKILITQIDIPQGNLPRVITGTKTELVEHYSELLKDGVEFPPIRIWKNNNSRYFIWDGLHRLSAAKHIGKKRIECKIYDFPEKEFLLYAFKANLSHGLPLKRQEKIIVVQNLYRGGHTIQDIAKKTGIKKRTLQRWSKPVREKQNQERSLKIKELSNQSLTCSEIAEKLKTSRQTVSCILNEREGSLPGNDNCRFLAFTEPAEEISNQQAEQDTAKLRYKDMDRKQKLRESNFPLEEPAFQEQIATLTDEYLDIIRILELIKEDLPIKEIEKDTGCSSVIIRHTAVGLMAHHNKIHFYNNGPYWVADQIGMKHEKLQFIWSLRHYIKLLPDRYQLWRWLNNSLLHNSDKIVKEFMRSEMIDQKCIEAGIDISDQSHEKENEVVETLPAKALEYLEACADIFLKLNNLFEFKALKKKPLQELNEYYNRFKPIINEFEDILHKNREKIM